MQRRTERGETPANFCSQSHDREKKELIVGMRARSFNEESKGDAICAVDGRDERQLISVILISRKTDYTSIFQKSWRICVPRLLMKDRSCCRESTREKGGSSVGRKLQKTCMKRAQHSLSRGS